MAHDTPLLVVPFFAAAVVADPPPASLAASNINMPAYYPPVVDSWFRHGVDHLSHHRVRCQSAIRHPHPHDPPYEEEITIGELLFEILSRIQGVIQPDVALQSEKIS